MLPRCGGLRRRPANLRGREEGSFQLGCLLPGLPGRLLCLCPPSPPAASPSPAQDARRGADGRGEGRKERAPQRAGWGRRHAGRGACAGKYPREASGGGAGCRWNCRDGRARPGRARGGPGSTQHAPSPGGREQRPAAAPSRPVLPWRPIRARLAGREAARGFYCGSAAAGAARTVSGVPG